LPIAVKPPLVAGWNKAYVTALMPEGMKGVLSRWEIANPAKSNVAEKPADLGFAANDGTWSVNEADKTLTRRVRAHPEQ
jgi:hypothetical protein